MEKAALNRFFLNESSPVERGDVIRWMLDPANDIVLKAWMKENWDLFSGQETVADPDVELIWSKVQASIRQEAVQSDVIALPSRKARKRSWIAAAAVLIAVIAGGYYLARERHSGTADNPLVQYGKNLVQVTNTSDTSQLLYLEDGSAVVLQHNASLQYPLHFTGNKREVSLTGEAFFDVQKDADKAFLVYAGNVVTRVLGTSFTIHSNASSREVAVSVRTGSVQVFERNSAETGPAGNKVIKTNGVILTANQKVVYTKEKNDFQTTLVERPVPLAGTEIQKGTFDFNREPLGQVIKKIEKVYGIEIVLESERFNNCIFSGDLSDENLYDKLDIICKAVNALYEIAGTKILVKREGCN